MFSCFHDMQSIEGSWNISCKGCELVVFSLKSTLLQRWTCSATSSPTPPPLSMWSSSTNGWSPHSKWISFLPSFLCLELSRCIGQCSVHSIHIKNLDQGKGIATLNIFYCPDLIFWIVMGCGIARFGFRPLRPKQAIPHPMTIQNMRFRRLENFCRTKFQSGNVIDVRTLLPSLSTTSSPRIGAKEGEALSCSGNCQRTWRKRIDISNNLTKIISYELRSGQLFLTLCFTYLPQTTTCSPLLTWCRLRRWTMKDIFVPSGRQSSHKKGQNTICSEN